MGQQPGTSSTSTSPASQPTADCYVRNFNGMYFYFLQNIAQTKHQLVFKYDWYDPNTDVSGDRYKGLGLAYLYYINPGAKVTIANERIKDETRTTKKNYGITTLRVQFKF